MNTKPAKRMVAAAGLATAGLLAAAAPATAAPATTAPATGDAATAQIRCGYYKSGSTAYYGHCDAPPRTDIIIRVESFTGDYDMCVKPGVTRLDPFATYAYYAHKLCWAG